tara:strand:- start:1523 stop:1837 length:315 start_codon:yes stop_codon:yes gene_type:complete
MIEIIRTVNATEDFKVRISIQSMLSGNVNEQIWDLDFREFFSDYKKWTDGSLLIQEALPYLNADQREFLMSGITNEEWNLEFNHDRLMKAEEIAKRRKDCRSHE